MAEDRTGDEDVGPSPKAERGKARRDEVVTPMGSDGIRIRNLDTDKDAEKEDAEEEEDEEAEVAMVA